MIQELIHQQIVKNCDAVNSWFEGISRDLPIPFYSSFDIRDAGYKVAPVDANLFPAGFNNICQVDKDNAPELAQLYMALHYPQKSARVLLLTEEHTKNAYYWDNVKTISDILKGAGREVVVGMPSPMTEPLKVLSASGHEITVFPAHRVNSGVEVNGKPIDLIICNNDFSTEHKDWINGLETPMNPPAEMGWYRRRKDQFFEHYNRLVGEVAKLINVDPWTLQVKTELFENFDINSETSRDELAQRVDAFLAELKKEYAARGITQEPFVFIKNNAGTYGLGVTQVKSGEEVRSWSYKARKKMKAAKGGGSINQVIIQEGVLTTVSEKGETAEPVIYMLGCQLAGGFLRVHGEKGPDESLNSPGAVFKRLCVTDLKVDTAGCPMENVYGWVAKVAMLSMAIEAKANDVPFRGYVPRSCKG